MKLQEGWYQAAAARRRTQGAAGVLVDCVFEHREFGEGALTAASHALIESVARRPVALTFEAGRSYAVLETGAINLDGTILRGDEEWRARAECLFGVAGHEAAHLRWSVAEGMPRDALFKYLYNVIEDERIEALLASEVEVLAKSLSVARRELIRPPADDCGFLEALFALIRCEDRLPEVLWEIHGERLARAMRRLTPFPTTPEEVLRCVLRVALLVPPEERDEVPEMPELVVWLSGEGDEDIDSGSFRDRMRDRNRHRMRMRAGAGRCGEWPPVVWATAESHKDAYKAIRSELGRRPADLADRLRALLPVEPNPRRLMGRLDRRRLSGYRTDPRLFTGTPRPGLALSIAIIIDLSGSMSGESEATARRVAILLNEAVAELPEVEIEIFGHAADDCGEALPEGETTCTSICRFPVLEDGRAWSLGKLPIGGNNRDAHAFRVVGDELLKSSASRRRIAIIIADGSPQARDFNGQAAIDKTRDAILWLEDSWGPVLFIATDSVPELRRMVPGPNFRFRSEAPVEELARHLTATIRRTKGA